MARGAGHPDTLLVKLFKVAVSMPYAPHVPNWTNSAGRSLIEQAAHLVDLQRSAGQQRLRRPIAGRTNPRSSTYSQHITKGGHDSESVLYTSQLGCDLVATKNRCQVCKSLPYGRPCVVGDCELPHTSSTYSQQLPFKKGSRLMPKLLAAPTFLEHVSENTTSARYIDQPEEVGFA